MAQSFARERSSFRLEVDVDPELQAPTVVYVPRVHFPDLARHGRITVTSGDLSYDEASQLLSWSGSEAGRQSLTLTYHEAGC